MDIHSGAACQHSWVHTWGPINTRQIQKFRAKVSTPRPLLYIICYEKLHSSLGLERNIHVYMAARDNGCGPPPRKVLQAWFMYSWRFLKAISKNLQGNIPLCFRDKCKHLQSLFPSAQLCFYSNTAKWYTFRTSPVICCQLELWRIKSIPTYSNTLPRDPTFLLRMHIFWGYHHIRHGNQPHEHYHKSWREPAGNMNINDLNPGHGLLQFRRRRYALTTTVIFSPSVYDNGL
jgi:hypothetical protein